MSVLEDIYVLISQLTGLLKWNLKEHLFLSAHGEVKGILPSADLPISIPSLKWLDTFNETCWVSPLHKWSVKELFVLFLNQT